MNKTISFQEQLETLGWFPKAPDTSLDYNLNIWYNNFLKRYWIIFLVCEKLKRISCNYIDFLVKKGKANEPLFF